MKGERLVGKLQGAEVTLGAGDGQVGRRVQRRGCGKGVVWALGLSGCLRILGRLTQGLGLSGFWVKFLGFLAREASG